MDTRITLRSNMEASAAAGADAVKPYNWKRIHAIFAQ